jgi:hypothetical protein
MGFLTDDLLHVVIIMVKPAPAASVTGAALRLRRKISRPCRKITGFSSAVWQQLGRNELTEFFSHGGTLLDHLYAKSTEGPAFVSFC